MEKLTKINILHVAINYIRALESILDTGDAGVQIYGTSIVQSPYLPLPPEPEIPEEKVAKTPPKPNPNIVKLLPQKSQLRTKNPSSSSSVDSGVHLDDGDGEVEEEGGGKSQQFGNFSPKNHQIISEFSPETCSSEGSNEDQSEPMICPDWTELTSTLELIPPRGNLDTLLSSTTVTDILAPKVALQVRDLNRSLSNISDFDPNFDLNSSSFLEFPEDDPFQLVVF